MPFVQNSEDDVRDMLAAIGVASIDELFADIPEAYRVKDGLPVPAGLSEADVLRALKDLTSRNRVYSDENAFNGGGIERHFIPHIVDHISLDGNFITAYTPYQPEVSQGTLTAIFQFQSFLSALTGLGVSNASLYDGATAVCEAALVAYHYTQKKVRNNPPCRLLVPLNLHPEYRETLETYVAGGGDIEITKLPYDAATGLIDRAAFDRELAAGGVYAALLPYPGFFGGVEDLTPFAKALHDAGATAIAVAHPLALGILKSPGEMGCDIAVGEGQPLGCYQALGGPAFGYFSCSQEYLRFSPGRIVSETVDREGTRTFCLALATREQHIRREKATSNICTNQALMALRASIYLAALGKQGMVELAEQIASHARHAQSAFANAGIDVKFTQGSTPIFNEFVVKAQPNTAARGKAAGVQVGIDLGGFYPELKGYRLITVGELNQDSDIQRLISLFKPA